MLPIAIKYHQDISTEFLALLKGTAYPGPIAPVLAMFVHNCSGLSSDLSSCIARSVIDHHHTIDVLLRFQHHRADKPFLVEARDGSDDLTSWPSVACCLLTIRRHS